MHFFKTLVGVAALATSVVAQSLAFTSAPSNVEEGTPVTFTWTSSDLSSPVTISLMQGPTNDLASVLVLTTTATGGSFTWTAGNDLVSDTNYAWEIQQGSMTNYWGPVVLNSGLEPGSSPTPAPVTTPMVTPTPMPSIVVPPPVNASTPGIPTPTPFSGAATLGASFTGLTVVLGAFALFL